MKVQFTNSTFYTQLNKILERDGNGHSGESPEEQQQQASSGKKQTEPEPEPCTLEKLSLALEHFEKDVQTQAYGLKAQIEGEGKGLRVLLKDQIGKVVRQLTGEEFIKMRANVLPLGLTCGKILDLKL